jgi:hypothetical protein
MDDFEDIEFENEIRNNIKVEGPSGAIYEVIHPLEKDYWNTTVKKYLSDYRFTNISDLQDLDRVVVQELMSYRYNQWVALEKDYWDEAIDVKEINRQIVEISKELRQLKKALGIDKVSREKDQGDSVAAYIESLRRRAHEFGVMRNEQSVKAITLFQELISLVIFYEQCTPDERKSEHIELEDIFEWIKTQAIPEFEEIDKKFRETQQKYWIADM